MAATVPGVRLYSNPVYSIRPTAQAVVVSAHSMIWAHLGIWGCYIGHGVELVTKVCAIKSSATPLRLTTTALLS
jgi:hypothetical protein